MARPLTPLILSPAQQRLLTRLVNSRETPHSLVQRAQLVVLAAAGERNKAISQRLGLCEDTVGLWRRRWVEASEELSQWESKPKVLAAAIEALLSDQPRPGAPGTFTAEQICQLVALACETPPEHLSHWTQPELARTAVERGIVNAISTSSVSRFLKSELAKTASDSVLAKS